MADRTPARAAAILRGLPALAWAALLATGYARGSVPLWVIVTLAGLCAVGFLLHGWDKRRARTGGRRVPEASLHLVELLGGWPGALLGTRLFRHKTAKFSYRAAFWLCAAANLAAVGWWVWRAG